MVGITYSGENPNYDSLRASDLTPAPGAPTAAENAANFLKFVKQELIPFIETDYRADPAQRVLQGNSLGGLFTLYALFTDPALFSRYVASSPAVNHAAILAIEAQFAKDHKELPARLFIGVGSAEGLSAPVQEFIKTLKAREYQGLKLETRVVEGEGHSGNKPETYNRGLRFVFAN
jgi:predicted alpha/beta superfamily hydrolase